MRAATGASSEAGEPDHRIIAYKENVARDPDRAEPTGLFPLGGANSPGSAYNGCITPRVEQPGPPVYRYYPWAPSPAWRRPGCTPERHERHDPVPGIVGYELDERTSRARRHSGPRNGSTAFPA